MNSIRWCLIAVLMLGGRTFAQQPGPKTIVWNQRSPQAEARFGILGEIEKPGVYTSSAAQVTLQELVQRAGGLGRSASPAIRIIRNGRAGQSVFFQPEGRSVLAPNDLVVVDALRDPRQSSTAVPQTPRADRSIWVALIGLSDFPEVVPVNPEQAQLPNIMKMLGQSPLLAKSIQTILPPGMSPAQSALPFDLLPNGIVLVFDRSLLVTANLPTFFEPLPLAEPAPASAVAVVPLPPAPPAIPATEAAAPSMPRTQVDAQPVPFMVRTMDEVPANPASLPAPGSRFAPPPPAETIPVPSELPRLTAGPPVIVEPETSSEPDLVGVPAVTVDHPASMGFNLWQLLGISGTVASLVGVALVSRQYLEQRSTVAGDLPPAIADRLRRPTPLPPRRMPIPAPIAQPVADSTLVRDELSELLNGQIAIESEPLEFPSRMVLSASGKSISTSEPAYRLDAAETPAPHLVMKPALDQQTTFFTDAAADAAPVPAPHFRYRKERVAAPVAEAAAMPPIAAGPPIERALSQIQEGRKS